MTGASADNKMGKNPPFCTILCFVLNTTLQSANFEVWSCAVLISACGDAISRRFLAARCEHSHKDNVLTRAMLCLEYAFVKVQGLFVANARCVRFFASGLLIKIMRVFWKNP